MKKIIISLLFLLLIVSGCGTSETITPTASTTPPTELKSEEILNDYIRDQTSADKKYKNMKVKITGKVLHKGQFKNSANFYIDIEKKETKEKSYVLVLDYPTDKVNDVNAKKINDFIVAKGVIRGIVPQDDPTFILIQVSVDTKE